MSSRRIYFLLVSFFFWAILIWARFFYWQVLRGERLATAEKKQAIVTKSLEPLRGEVFAKDNQPLILNERYFDLYLWRPILNLEEEILLTIISDKIIFSDQKEKANWLTKTKKRLYEKGSDWILIEKGLTKEEADQIETLSIRGLFLEEEQSRFYPEGSSSAHLLGFLGMDQSGKKRGYFGIEGFYNRQLQGYSRMVTEASGWWNKIQDVFRGEVKRKKGRNLVLFLDRTVQAIVEEELGQGIKKYGAESGWAVVIDPFDGGVLAMAASPAYDPLFYYQFAEELFPNPLVAKNFEPGSIFKPFIVAAALQEKIVEPDTPCSSCAGPVIMGEYQIETWDKKYYPESTVSEIIQHSDNVGMVWLAQKLGKEKILKYLEKFNFGQKTQIDLEEEAAIPLKEEKEWYPIDLATVSFGQGIAVTPIQLVSAFSAFANGGYWVRPRMVMIIRGEEPNKETTVYTAYKEKIIDEEVAWQIRDMLVNAVENGEAKWAKIPGYSVAGKTGTAQIAIRGHYDEENTIASFIGFAPAEKPKFVMLVSLNKPTSSPWGSETAAPVWFKIAKRLFFYWGIAPN